MSEVILKRKTRHIKVPISGIGKNGFSLNGGYRNVGAVGPTNLGKRIIRTPHKGVYPVGSGGRGGKFVQNILSNNTCCTNDPDIVKRSTMNTKGLILATVTHPTSVFTDCSGSCVKNWVKDFNALNYSQSMFIRTLKIKNICPYWLDETITCHTDPTSCKTICDVKLSGHPNTKVYPDCNTCDTKTHFIGTRKVVTNTITKELRRGAISSGDYISGHLQARQCLPPPPCKEPFPIALNHQGCDINFLTPEDAIQAGALSEDWGKCNSVYACERTTHCAFKHNPYTHCKLIPQEIRLACPKLGCTTPPQAASDLRDALTRFKWIQVTKESNTETTPVVAVLTFKSTTISELQYTSWWRGMGNPGNNSGFEGQRCPYAGQAYGTNHCLPYGYSSYPAWGSSTDDCSSGGPSSSVMEWLNANRECILLKVTYEEYHICGDANLSDLWEAPDGTTKLYKADLGKPANVSGSYMCGSYDSITHTQLMAIPYGYTEPSSTESLSVEQIQNGSYGSPSELVYIDCIDWYPLYNKSAPWRSVLTNRSLDSPKPIGIGGINSLFFKVRHPGQDDEIPWSDKSQPDTTYIPLDSTNSCPFMPDSLDLKTLTVTNLTDNQIVDLTPSFSFWKTDYIAYLPHDFNGTLSFSFTQFPLAKDGYGPDISCFRGNILITKADILPPNGPVEYIKPPEKYLLNTGTWSNSDWSNPGNVKTNCTTICWPTQWHKGGQKTYTVTIKRQSPPTT